MIDSVRVPLFIVCIVPSEWFRLPGRAARDHFVWELLRPTSLIVGKATVTATNRDEYTRLESIERPV